MTDYVTNCGMQMVRARLILRRRIPGKLLSLARFHYTALLVNEERLPRQRGCANSANASNASCLNDFLAYRIT